MLADTGRLLRLYWLLDRRESFKLSGLARIVQVVALLIVVVVSAAVGYFAGVGVRSPDMPFRLDPGLVPGFILTFLLLATILFGTNQALRALFMSGDLDRLLSTPVSARAVMIAKLLSRLPSTVIFLFVLALPAITAFGIGLGLGPLYYIVGLLLVLVSPLFGLALGAMLSMVLVRVLPANRLNEYLGAASIFIGIIFMVIFQLPNLMRGRLEDVEGAAAAAAVEGALNTAQNLPLPPLQAGQDLVALGQGRLLEGLDGVSTFLLMTLGLFAAVIVLGDRLYLSSWLRMQGSGQSRHTSLDAVGRTGVFGGSSVAATIGVKDWLLRLREPRQLMGLVTQIVALGVMVFVILRPGSDESMLTLVRNGVPPGAPAFLSFVFSPGLFISGTIVFAIWALFSSLAVTALSLEQRSFYVLKSAPLSGAEVLRSKALSVIVPAGVIATLLFIGNWFLFRFDLGWTPYGLLSILIITTMILALSTAVGILYPRLDWDDPRRMTTQRASWYSFLGSIIVAVPALLVAAGAFALGTLFPAAAVAFMALGLLLQALYSYLIWRGLSRRVDRAWPRLGAD